MEQGKKLLAVRRWSRLWEANAAMTSCVSRNFDFCARTNLYLLRERSPFNVTIRLIHHADDRLCVWNPSNQDMRLLQQQGFTITHITGWRAYLGTAQHNYPHWTRVTLPEGRQDIAQLESTPGVLPFEVYSQAPLRLISWCSFELPQAAKRLLRELAIMCELPETTTQALVSHIAIHNSQVRTEQEATQYLASLATVSIASRAKYNCLWPSTC